MPSDESTDRTERIWDPDLVIAVEDKRRERGDRLTLREAGRIERRQYLPARAMHE